MRHTITPVPVRRFEMGASAMGSDGFLRARGYRVASAGGNCFRLFKDGAKGRPKRLNQKQLIELLDQLRIADGREPIRLRKSK